MRDLKKRLILSMAEDDKRLAYIEEKLATSPPKPAKAGAVRGGGTELGWEEEPERREVVSDLEVEEFVAKKAAREAKAKGGGGAMGGMGGGMGASGGEPAEEASASETASPQPPPKPEMSPSDFERGAFAISGRSLSEEKARLLAKRARMVSSYDTALTELRTEKLKLEADLKTTDLRKLVLFKELQLLKEFEKKDISLAKRLEQKHGEKGEIVARVAECQDKLAQKKVRLSNCYELTISPSPSVTPSPLTNLTLTLTLILYLTLTLNATLTQILTPKLRVIVINTSSWR